MKKTKAILTSALMCTAMIAGACSFAKAPTIYKKTANNAVANIHEVRKDFENLAAGEQFGGFVAVEEEGNTYIKASGSGWTSPVQTAKLYDDELVLGTHWTMSARLYLVGHMAGNISFVSSDFYAGSEDSFDKFFFWHTDENNGYVQSRKACQDADPNWDGAVVADPGWLTLHAGFADDTVGTEVHDAWVTIELTRNENVLSFAMNGKTLGDYTIDQNVHPFGGLSDISFRIMMGDPNAEVRLDDFVVVSHATTHEVVDAFVTQYMHMTDIAVGEEGTGLCAGENGYYALAKAELLDIEAKHDGVIKLLSKDTRYAAAWERLQAWALANGEVFLEEGSVESINNFNMLTNNNFIIALIVVSTIGLLLTSLLVFKKRKFNK